jgi:alkanesulfonate monooxygenase SsuD/methylene tetrahydromethanopterin reductase-like flavin-dependent oxidoreductase (luciferase family)
MPLLPFGYALRLGILVTGIHHRHPAVLANMVFAIDIISAGRLELESAPSVALSVVSARLHPLVHGSAYGVMEAMDLTTP